MKIKLPEGIQDADYENLENTLAFVSQDIISFKVARIEMQIHLVLRAGADEDLVRKKVDELIGKVLTGELTAVKSEVLFENQADVPCREDVFAELLKRREVIEHGPGLYSLHGTVAKMFRSLDENLRKFALSQNAEEVVYPVKIPISTLHKSHFFSNYPHFANFVSTLKENSDDISMAAKKIDKNNQGNFLEHLNRPEQICRSAGCVHSYPSFENQVVDADFSKTITMQGRIFRNESSNVKSLERLNEYSMRELIYFGSKDFVTDKLKACLDWFRIFLVEGNLLGAVQYANDPFFADNLATLQFFQRSQQTKIEVRMLNPASGNHVSVASINNHGSHFSKSYNIRFKDQNYITTGCVGFGYERLIFLVLSQHGLETSKWPLFLRGLLVQN